MIRQIAIFGLNGSGKSTLGHALARETGLFEMDAEDYYFPEQKASRHWALEHTEIMNTEYLGDLPFSVARSGEEAQTAVLADLDAHDGFILSGVTLNWCQEILSRIRIAFRVQTPAEERIRRIQRREERRFGARVLPGGDMFEQQKSFREFAAKRDERAVEVSAAGVTCPVIALDGMLPVGENLRIMIAALERGE